jgi:hypothetical protein
LEKLGCESVSVPFFDDPSDALGHDAIVRVVLVEAGDRPDLAPRVLRVVRACALVEDVKSIVAIPERQVMRLDPASGFDDFIVAPYFPAELYARIRALEWKGSEFLTEERLKLGAIVVDRASHAVTVDGRPVELTAKEFALLVWFMQHRGRAFSRETLLARVWGRDYEGGARTVDIHVRRLRAKLGEAFALSTLRGTGYKLGP